MKKLFLAMIIPVMLATGCKTPECEKIGAASYKVTNQSGDDVNVYVDDVLVSTVKTGATSTIFPIHPGIRVIRMQNVNSYGIWHAYPDLFECQTSSIHLAMACEAMDMGIVKLSNNRNYNIVYKIDANGQNESIAAHSKKEIPVSSGTHSIYSSVSASMAFAVVKCGTIELAWN